MPFSQEPVFLFFVFANPANLPGLTRKSLLPSAHPFFFPYRHRGIARVTEFAWNHPGADIQERGPCQSWHPRHAFPAHTKNGVPGTLAGSSSMRPDSEAWEPAQRDSSSAASSATRSSIGRACSKGFCADTGTPRRSSEDAAKTSNSDNARFLIPSSRIEPSSFTRVGKGRARATRNRGAL